MSFKNLETILEQFPRPENIENLTTPRVTRGMWSKLSLAIKASDLKLAKVGDHISKVITGKMKNPSVRKELKELAKMTLQKDTDKCCRYAQLK